jgi:hypothetical protein
MNVLLKKFGLLSVIAVWGLAACGDDSSSAPVDFGDLQNVASSSSIGVPSSSSAPVSSSDVIGSSSSVVANSSSSEALPASSQSIDECVHMPHFDKSEQVSHQVPICTEEGTTAPDCETDDVYVCQSGFWRDIKETCMDVAPTSCDAPGCGPKHCDASGPQSAIDCKSGKEYVCENYWVPAGSCVHISDVESDDKWNCDEPDFTLKMDCKKSSPLYMCASGMWIEAKGCDTSKEKCGYSEAELCTKFGIMKYCNGQDRILPDAVPCNKPGSSVVIDGHWMYRCDNGKWHIVVPLPEA